MEQREKDWASFFDHRVERVGDCVMFSGAKDDLGYGTAQFRGKVCKTHRISYALANGPITDGMCVCHSCDNPSCVNPEHLWLGTVADNNRDRDEKGRLRVVPSPGSKNGTAKLNEKDVAAILKNNKPASFVAEQYGVSAATVNLIRAGKIWRHVPGERVRSVRKLTPEQAAAIRSDTRPQSAIAAEYGVSQSLVSMVKNRRVHAEA